MIFNKLVRDKIPEIIEQDGKTCKTRILTDDEYLQALNAKLQEEVNEYLECGSVEELADIEEVLRAILARRGIEYKSLEAVRKVKAYHRGAFKKKIFLESVEDTTND